jgi:hypothetical protein
MSLVDASVVTLVDSSSTSSNISSSSPPPLFAVGQPVALRQSPLWLAMSAASSSPSSQNAPPLVASNAFLAAAYARVILGFLRDWYARADAVSDEPVLIVDVRAGRGRLPFLILRELVDAAELWPDAGPPPTTPGAQRIPFLFVVADPDVALVDAAESNEAFLRFSDAGLVSFAAWDAADINSPLILRATKHTPAREIKKGSLRNAIVGIGNYACSPLVADVLQCHDGIFKEAHAALFSTSETDAAAVTAEELPRQMLSRLRVEWSFQPIE